MVQGSVLKDKPRFEGFEVGFFEGSRSSRFSIFRFENPTLQNMRAMMV